ncbi:formate dehydrogenase iron-sulfur subunit [Actinopolymorpha cephalotaxi]|uniref:Formate dehydrogenase iron-sulfur subunit n=1 Tax=Actinopolymorpha cephalotaxi TaxID=504797 RepID=A0A1I2XS13_9ACTN|nr:4Fe-4S dicluster domain-containing protein [Actinopolymorpha cephalotaxi]NYH87152.1 formate dehydrogenase iron-sulfur subunit [Actinopolymorpha cephalotaxi]SFH16155.1 formate dehydrogenase iron-sulfur subunit [Actinopolymorpha cephalotaxi]
MNNRLAGPLADPAGDAGHPDDHPQRVGFFTDTSVCIGCKACEVACKEWNALPEDGLDLLGQSYDNTGALGASTWRHVAFVEQQTPSTRPAVDLGMPGVGTPAQLDPATARTVGEDGGIGDGAAGEDAGALRWLMSSDVCKHCTHAACLDVCPTGALFRTEFGTVVVQDDVCNGCGYCVSACPYGVIDIRPDNGGAFKCTMCYDRLGDGLEPACAKACPTKSIQFGPLDELRETARERVAALQEAGVDTARLYGADPDDGVGGDGAFFLLLDEPEVYGLPPDPVVTTRDLPAMWRQAGLAAATVAVAVAASFLGRRR